MTTEGTHDHTSQPVPSVGSRPRRVGWAALALFLAAFAIFESLKYGLATTAAALAFFALPDLARLAGVRRSGLLHHAVHRVWIPLVVLVAYTFGPIVWPPLFTAALGWLARIAVNRVFHRRTSSARLAEHVGCGCPMRPEAPPSPRARGRRSR